MDESKIILTDIDDVLWYFVESWIDWLNHRHGLAKSVEECYDWDIRTVYPNLTGEQLFEPLFLASFWKTIKPREDAQQIIPKLQKDGYTIKCCSATNFRHATAKLEIFSKYFPTIRDEDIILCDDKRLIRGKYLIDDKLTNLANRECPILMHTWHNREDSISDNIKRVYTWEDVYNYIKQNEAKTGPN